MFGAISNEWNINTPCQKFVIFAVLPDDHSIYWISKIVDSTFYPPVKGITVSWINRSVTITHDVRPPIYKSNYTSNMMTSYKHRSPLLMMKTKVTGQEKRHNMCEAQKKSSTTSWVLTFPEINLRLNMYFYRVCMI